MNDPEVLGAALNALLGIQPVIDSDVAGGVAGQHHQAAHTGGRYGVGAPVGFLVTHGGEEAPVNVIFLGVFPEQRLVFGQSVIYVVHERARAHIVQLVQVAVKAFRNLGQCAFFAELRQKLCGGIGQ